MNTSIKLAGITLKNPIATASGTFGYGLDVARIWDLSLLGAITTKSISLEPWEGAPTPRIVETPDGMMNAIGLQNPGVEKFTKDILPELKKHDTSLIVNIVEKTTEGFAELAAKLDGVDGIAALEINASCPNYASGKLPFGTDSETMKDLTNKVKKNTKLPVLIKLSPNVTDIVSIAKTCEEAGADGISMINTLIGMKIDLNTRKPFIGFKTGGLSGPAIKPVAVRMIYQVAKAINIPILGMGGIATGEDVIEFILAGAHAVAIGTTNFTDTYAAPNIIKEVETWMEQNGVEDINEIRGEAYK